MSNLRLPEGAEAGFRIEVVDEHGPVFTMHLYGSGRKGWFLLSSPYAKKTDPSAQQQLQKGQWRTFLGLIRQSRFWELPATLPNPFETESGQVTADGGGWVIFTGREGERYHRIHRDWEFEPGFVQVLRFCQQLSGLFSPRMEVPVEPTETNLQD